MSMPVGLEKAWREEAVEEDHKSARKSPTALLVGMAWGAGIAVAGYFVLGLLIGLLAFALTDRPALMQQSGTILGRSGCVIPFYIPLVIGIPLMRRMPLREAQARIGYAIGVVVGCVPLLFLFWL
jgi:hypothetical protein